MTSKYTEQGYVKDNKSKYECPECQVKTYKAAKFGFILYECPDCLMKWTLHEGNLIP